MRAVVFAIYVDSYAFVFSSAVLQHSFGTNSNPRACDAAILLCLVCYVTTKVGGRLSPLPLAGRGEDSRAGSSSRQIVGAAPRARSRRSLWPLTAPSSLCTCFWWKRP